VDGPRVDATHAELVGEGVGDGQLWMELLEAEHAEEILCLRRRVVVLRRLPQH